MSTKKCKISVTREDIDKGVRLQGDCCPIALAAQRVFSFPVHVTETQIKDVTKRKAYLEAHYTEPFISLTDSPTVTTLPEEASAFVKNFDQTHYIDDRSKLQPFEFEVEVPEEVGCNAQ